MAKIAVFSDTHGSIESLSFFLERIGSVDSLFHLGDYAADARRIADRLQTGFVSVRGNCDGFSSEPTERIVTWFKHRLLLLHGHLYPSRDALLYKAESERCSVVCFGHTHVPFIGVYDDILLINPGSLSRPRSSRGSSCTLLHVDEKNVRAELLFVEPKSFRILDENHLQNDHTSPIDFPVFCK